MRGVELSPDWLADELDPTDRPTPHAPRSFRANPATSAPYPPLISGGWYQTAEQEVDGPGRYPMARRAEKSAVAAVLWTVSFGPLGLCYVSAAGGLIAAAVTVVVVMAGGVLTLATIWPIAIVLALLAVFRQQPGRRPRTVRSRARRPRQDSANTWFLSNV